MGGLEAKHRVLRHGMYLHFPDYLWQRDVCHSNLVLPPPTGIRVLLNRGDSHSISIQCNLPTFLTGILILRFAL